MAKTGIVAFAFGVPYSIESNRWIAREVSLYASELDAPVYTQLDVRVSRNIDATYTDEEPGNPPPTLRIARGAVRWAMERELQLLFVFAAKPHLRRCLRDLRFAVSEAGASIRVETIRESCDSHDQWFCPDSTQPRTRSWWAWWSREAIVRFMPMSVYNRIAN